MIVDGTGEVARTLGPLLRERRTRLFVGREAEVELFRSAIESDRPPFSVLFVHGPGGIGKSSLLDVLAQYATAAGAAVLRADGAHLAESENDLIGGVRHRSAASSRPVVMIDSYERVGVLDGWVRTELLPSLPASGLAVLAGRSAPAARWRADPAWRDLLRVVSLRNLGRDHSLAYLHRCGVPEPIRERLVQTSYGHPLGLSLLADLVLRGGNLDVGELDAEGVNALPPELVHTLLKQFVDVVPTVTQRQALEVCALARVTTEALLRDVIGERDTAHELFHWLRGLSFVRSGPDGLQPHELARDVLDVDLRWRDLDGYKRTFRSVRRHIHRRLAETRGRDQQRAIFDEKYVFRNLPSILSPVDWTSWGVHYPEPARPDEYDEIVELIERWEGPESAAIALRWLSVQPQGFFVLRERGAPLRGVLALLDLTAAAADELAGDPGAAAAMAFARRAAPPRVDEVVSQARFVVDRDQYQGPSPTLNAGPILSIQRYLQTPNLAWDFLTLHEPDRWNDYFTVADLPRAQGADFTVGQRRYGLFAHDFRRVPVDAWLDLVTERALVQDFSLPPHRDAEALVLAKEDFTAAVKQALRDLGRPDLLNRNPLLHSRLVHQHARDHQPDGLDLEGLLSDAVDALRNDPRDDKLFRAVEGTYVRRVGTQEAVAEALGVPFSSYRRHLTAGVDRVVAWLWDREVYGAAG